MKMTQNGQKSEGGSLPRSVSARRRMGGEKDPRSFSRRVDHRGYLSGSNLQPSGQRSDVPPAQPSGQLLGGMRPEVCGHATGKRYGIRCLFGVLDVLVILGALDGL